MTTHSNDYMFAGDDWEIRATLKTDTGEAFDLTFPHTILWRLVDQLGVIVIDTADVVINTLNAATGDIQIIVPHAVTTRLLGGLHKDYLRIVFQAVYSTLSTGIIMVTGDPFFTTVTETGGNLMNGRPNVMQRGVVVVATGFAGGTSH